MPEGDTVYQLATFLRPLLRDRCLVDARVRGAAATDLVGVRIDDVTAHGKHLFIAFDGERVLRSHLGMHGSWHHYAAGETWRRPTRQASIVLDTGERVYVCFNALQVELLRGRGVRARHLAQVLGPDLMQATVDVDAVVARALQLSDPQRVLVDVLLDQRIACGIGNVYKSEVLFLERQHPATPLQALDASTLAALYRRASTLLRANTDGGRRITRHTNDDAGILWVYRRRGLPCLRCATPIVTQRMGRGGRSTYWCPSCQPALSPAPTGTSAASSRRDEG